MRCEIDVHSDTGLLRILVKTPIETLESHRARSSDSVLQIECRYLSGEFRRGVKFESSSCRSESSWILDASLLKSTPVSWFIGPLCEARKWANVLLPVELKGEITEGEECRSRINSTARLPGLFSHFLPCIAFFLIYLFICHLFFVVWLTVSFSFPQAVSSSTG